MSVGSAPSTPLWRILPSIRRPRFTLDRIVADGLALTAWLAARFDEQKIYLTGNSWGSTLGVLMAQQRPELFWAYVGTRQMVSQRATDTMLYDQLLAYADRTSNPAMRRELESFGRPPYRDVLGYAKVMEYYDVLEPYQTTPEFESARGISGFFPSEYSLLDTWNELRGLADMGVYPQLQASIPAPVFPGFPSTSFRALTSSHAAASSPINGSPTCRHRPSPSTSSRTQGTTRTPKRRSGSTI